MPLIVVQTQSDRLVDRKPLPGAAEEMVRSFETHFALQHSAVTGRGNDDLVEAIAEGYATIPQPTIGRVRASVKRKLEDMIAAGEPRAMSLAAFRALCDAEGGVSDAELFLDVLHNAGTVFYRRGYFHDELILDQAWAITAIYALFERQSTTYQALKSMGGRFTRTLLGQLLWDSDYSLEEQELFLSMMQACGICFELRRAQPDRDIEVEYVAPDLLPEVPRYGGWNAEIAAERQERHYAHLPGTLIRGVISAIGQEAGLQGDYWCTGVSVFETRYRSWGVVESEMIDDAAGRLVLRTREGAAGAFLAALARIVQREEARLGLKPQVSQEEAETALDRVVREPVGRNEVDERRAHALEYGVPRQERASWFFSYANESERAQGNPVRAFCDAVKEQKGITVRRDVEELRYGDEIEAFMRELSAGDRIFVWLTDAYLRSPYCMFELHEIWRQLGQDGNAFDARVVVVLGDARIRTESDLKKYRDFWTAERDAAYDRLKDTADTEHATKILLRIDGIIKNTDRILTYITSRIRIADFPALANKELGDG